MVSEGREEERPLLTVILPSILFIGLWSGFCAALVHQGCSDISPATPVPVPHTPRASFCDPATAVTPWLSLMVVPTALVAMVATLNRRHPRRVALCAFVVALLLAAIAIVANSLSYSVGLR